MKLRYLQRLAQARRGAAAIEFAIAAPVVFLFIFGLSEGGMLIGTQHAVELGVFSAARYAVVHGSKSLTPASTGQIQSAFVAAASPFLGNAASNCPVTVSYSNGQIPGSTVTVSASCPWAPVTALVGMPAVNVTDSTTLTIQN